ncbi:hypothetical protein Rhe02_53860 [Rhizocola hellebori]|uniref:ESX-1 secretion-associated protein n=1 Tax=Rhizocola hellebori TaxID=1392758 RepID=A0A8J3QAR3_9ACTN|nr:hypothetical protein [Rhizocola hellebori]GIH07319.1 hypothetical protein Rhe02_53860 [Rhizocola hellebori]
MSSGVAVGRETRVDPQRLLASASVCRDLRSGIGRMISEVEPETEAAIGATPGWLFRKALQDLMEAQRDDMRRLGQRLDSTAQALESSAGDYTRGENANAASFRRAEQPW